MLGKLDLLINDEISLQHSEAFGKEFVRRLCIEECAELIQALSKVERYPENPETHINLAEEAADVYILLNELLINGSIDRESMAHHITMKMERQREVTKDEIEDRNRLLSTYDALIQRHIAGRLIKPKSAFKDGNE